jgi:hypothetical protein
VRRDGVGDLDIRTVSTFGRYRPGLHLDLRRGQHPQLVQRPIRAGGGVGEQRAQVPREPVGARLAEQIGAVLHGRVQARAIVLDDEPQVELPDGRRR